MIEKFLSSNIIEMAINAALKLDPQAQEKLSSLEGKHIAFMFDFSVEPWIFTISQGYLRIVDYPISKCDVRLQGNIKGFLYLFRNITEKQPQDVQLYIEGDLHVAQQFQRVMKTLSPDFNAVLRNYLGESMGNLIASVLHQTKERSQQVVEQFEEKLRKTIESETSPFLNRELFSRFKIEVEDIQHRINQLQKRFYARDN